MDYEELLSLIGIGKYHYRALLYCALANMADSIEIVAISFVISSAKEELGMSQFDEGILTGIIFLGMLVGGWVWGSMADQPQFGRKRILFYALLMNGVFGLLSCLAVNFWMMLVFRFCSGVGVGGSVPVIFCYAAELFPAEHRAKSLAILAVAWPVGSTLTAALAYAIIPQETILGFSSWRVFLVPCCVPAFLTAIAFATKLTDYSPKWLIYSKHDYPAASATLVKIATTNGVYGVIESGGQSHMFDASTLNRFAVDKGQADDGSDLQQLLNKKSDAVNAESQEQEAKEQKLSYKLYLVWTKTTILFSTEYRRSHILMSIVWFALSFGFYGLAEWLPTYFQGIDDVNEYKSTLFTSAAQFPGAVACVFILDICCDGRIALAVAIGLGAVSLIAIPYLETGEQIVITMCVFNGVTVIAWSALNVVSTALAPTFIRSTSYGFFAACGRLGAIIGNVMFGVFGSDDLVTALTNCGVVLLMGTVCCLLLPSTRYVPTSGH